MMSAPTRDAACTVVVVTYNSATVVAECVRSLPAALAGIASSEIIVVDNASTDATIETALEAARHDADGVPDIRVLQLDDNGGYAAAINAGIGAASLDGAVLVLNPDVRLQPGSVARLAEALDQPLAGIAVPRIVDGDGTTQPSIRREPTSARCLAEALLGGRVASTLGMGETVTADIAYESPGSVEWATGAVMLIARRCLDDVGLLDTSFFLYSEETDYMLRAADAGYATRFVPEATAVHLGGELEHAPDLWALRTVNRVRLHRRRHGRAATVAFLAASLVGEALRAISGRATSRRALAELLRRGPGIALGRPQPPEPAVPGWICFSAQDWWYHNRAHSDFQLLRRVAQRRPVLLVNSIGLRVPLPGRSSGSARRIARKLGSVARGVRRPDPTTPGFRVMTPVPLPFYRNERLRRLNAWSVRTQVRLAAGALGITGDGRDDPVVVVTIPTAIDAVRELPHRALVVNRSDKHSSFPESDRNTIEQLERACLEAADLVFYSSTALLEDERSLTDDRARLLDHGVDAGLFSRVDPVNEPVDLAAIPHPRVGFFGSLDDYLVDFDLLERVARDVRDAQLVLIGDATCSMRRFDPYPNVHHLSFRPYERIPAYGSGFDVALMPWLDNEWIRYANPIKLKEYLALGLPIVSTDFPESHRYGHLLRIAATSEAFVQAVVATIEDGGPGTPASRRDAVAHLTWDRTALQLLHEAESVPRVPRVPRAHQAGRDGRLTEAARA